LLQQHGDDSVSLGVVLEPSVSDALQRRDPRARLDRENLGPFCTLAEEVSHFLYLLYCVRAARSVTELELELQGELDKYLSEHVPADAAERGRRVFAAARAALRGYRLHERHGPGASRALIAPRNELAWRYSGLPGARLFARRALGSQDC
jgi:hypothetical protein